MTSIQFVVHPLPGTQEQLQEKLREVADRLNKYNTSGTVRHPVYSVFRIRTGSGSREAEGFFCSLKVLRGGLRITDGLKIAQQVQHLRYGMPPRTFGSVVADPDPNWIRIQSVSGSGSGSRRAKMTHKNRKKVQEISCFKVLDVLFWGLKASSVAWTSFMET